MADGTDLLRAWWEQTSLDPRRAGGRTLDWENRPASYKEYPGAARLPLEMPENIPTADLWQALQQRRSRRDLAAAELGREQLALLLWACQGITARLGTQLLRTAPSAGALYPFETYVSLQRVAGLSPCLTHLHIPGFHLEVLTEGEFGPHLAHAALGQEFVADAAAVVVWTAVLPRCTWKYGPRALRYLGLDLGHVGQNLALAAAALGLSCCPVAAFLDRELNAVLEVDGTNEFAYYLAAVGPAPRGRSPEPATR
ncbi:MAG: SagB/ThcOx family dehydrogenase [Deferrisomatales bacterium]|nr:SagB/ThcOx family dehydrogenase [Deferrisomatales bacterium]